MPRVESIHLIRFKVKEQRNLYFPAILTITEDVNGNKGRSHTIKGCLVNQLNNLK